MCGVPWSSPLHPVHPHAFPAVLFYSSSGVVRVEVLGHKLLRWLCIICLVPSPAGTGGIGGWYPLPVHPFHWRASGTVLAHPKNYSSPQNCADTPDPLMLCL